MVTRELALLQITNSYALPEIGSTGLSIGIRKIH